MPSYPAKPYVVPHDDWFNNNTTGYKHNSKTKETKNISTIHKFFYRQSDVKVGGSDNYIWTKFEKKSTTKIIISSIQNSDESFLPKSKKKYSYSKIPTELKSIKKSSGKGNSFYEKLINKNIFNFRSYLLDLKSLFFKILNRKNNKLNQLCMMNYQNK